ncbi:MAG: hypothetical protein K8S20_13645 [Chloroflexi bacterium]|nr:hypothetical protein [Chloroflexota bacterium]
MNTILAVLTGLFVRLIVPLAITALVVFALRKLDARWQAEAELERKTLVKDEMPCWKEQGLSTEEIKFRAEKDNQPCWQTHRLSNGYLREACLDCEVFLDAPVPAPKHLHAHL